ncbi:MAG: PAS domain-containing protein [Anaerolineae bacterium]|nr:PAS domain-containing protein [Anaerolineae bacterium]
MSNLTTPLQHSLFDHLRQEIPHGLPIIRCTKSTLVHLSHILEDTVLKNKIPAMLFTGFQESSHWREETQRYDELADIALQVCIFAGKPLPSESHAKQLHIELADGDPLRQEWFLLILSDRFSVLLCGQDRLDNVANEEDREFDTIWTFNRSHINQTLDILEDVIKQYRPDRLLSLQQARQTYTLSAPDESLLSQFFIDVLSHENILDREIRRQSALLQNVMRHVGLYAYTIETNSKGDSHVRLVFGDFDTLFGYTIGISDNPRYWFDKLIHPEDKSRFEANQKKLLHGVMASNDYRYIRSDGGIIWLRIMSQTVATKDGTTRYGIFMDVTPLYKANEIEHENKRLEHELKQEKELNAARNYFINSVMHEFRNPLASILLASEILERYKHKMSEEDKDKRLRIIQTQIVQLRDTLDDMSLIMNNQLSELGFHPTPHHAGRYMGDLIARFREGRGASHQLILEDTLTADDNHMLDLRLLKYIIPPILRNAIDFSAQGTTIICKVWREGDTLIFSVTDKGIGIPKDDQAHIFEPMYRAKNIPPAQHGGGLGLTIAHQCVTLHHGTIEFESQEGIGSVFRVIIPYLPALF